MAEGVSAEQCGRTMERVHVRIDSVEKTTASIETSARIIEQSVCKMEKLMYGNENADGIITKVSNLGQKVGGVFWFGGVVIIALISTLVAIIFKH